MRVLHVAGGNLTQGAARGAYWLHNGLQSLGIDSIFLVQGTKGREPNVTCLATGVSDRLKSFWYSIRCRMPIWAYWKRRDLFSSGYHGFDLTCLSEYADADIVHLHWIPSGIVGLNSFPNMQKPVIWTFRDMWPFTGGCHYAMECTNFHKGCGKCPVLVSEKKNDLSRRVFEKKRQVYGSNIHPVAISQWIGKEALKSPLFTGREIRVIPNGIDVDIFKPLGKLEARKRLALQPDQKIVLVGAQNLQNKYKGFDHVLKILPLLKNAGYSFLFFGILDESLLAGYDIVYRSLGPLKDDQTLREAYSAADVFLAPSIQEAFGKTLIESMACGTPVVSYNATGPKDIVLHHKTGFLARPYDIEALAEGVRWVTAHAERGQTLSKNSRATVEQKYSIGRVARQYLAMYEEILLI